MVAFSARNLLAGDPLNQRDNHTDLPRRRGKFRDHRVGCFDLAPALTRDARRVAHTLTYFIDRSRQFLGAGRHRLYVGR